MCDEPDGQRAKAPVRRVEIAKRELEETQHGAALNAKQCVRHRLRDRQRLLGRGTRGRDLSEVGPEERLRVEGDPSKLLVAQLVGEFERGRGVTAGRLPPPREPVHLEQVEEHVPARAFVPARHRLALGSLEDRMRGVELGEAHEPPCERHARALVKLERPLETLLDSHAALE